MLLLNLDSRARCRTFERSLRPQPFLLARHSFSEGRSEGGDGTFFELGQISAPLDADIYLRPRRVIRFHLLRRRGKIFFVLVAEYGHWDTRSPLAHPRIPPRGDYLPLPPRILHHHPYLLRPLFRRR